jgi:hypothetical protein
VFTLVYEYDVTIPAGTTAADPLVTLTQFEANEVERIEWLFPDGCCGLVGIQVGARSVPVIPHSNEQWLIRSGDSSGMDLTGQHNTGDWSVIGYNDGAYPHTVHVTFKVHRTEPPNNPDLLLVAAEPVTGMAGYDEWVFPAPGVLVTGGVR